MATMQKRKSACRRITPCTHAATFGFLLTLGVPWSLERMLNAWLPVAFKGSRFAERIPIGTEQSIMAATPSKIHAFYNSWYRPDLQAVIAVGDFDPAVIESQIKKHFGGIPAASADAPKRLNPAGLFISRWRAVGSLLGVRW